MSTLRSAFFVPGFFDHAVEGLGAREETPFAHALRDIARLEVTQTHYDGQSIPEFVERLRHNVSYKAPDVVIGYSTGFPIAVAAFQDLWPETKFVGINPPLFSGLTWRGFLASYWSLCRPFNEATFTWFTSFGKKGAVAVPTVEHAQAFFFNGNAKAFKTATEVQARCHPTAYRACLDLSFPSLCLGSPIVTPVAGLFDRSLLICGNDDQVVTADEWRDSYPDLPIRSLDMLGNEKERCHHGSMIFDPRFANQAARGIRRFLGN